MKKKIFYATLLAATFLFIACKEEVLAPEITGMDTGTAEYTLYIGEKVTLAPNITNLHGSNHYLWLIDNKEVATGNLDYTFTATKPGTFIITFRAENKGGMNEKHFKVFVDEPIRIAFAQEKVEVPRCEVIEISPVITGPQRDDYQYEWAIGDSILGNKPTLEFISAKPGTYTLTLKAKADRQTETSSCAVEVKEADYKVFPPKLMAYRPSVWEGAFWDWCIPEADESFAYPPEEMIQKLNEYLSNQSAFPKFELDAWGSYIVVGFDHKVVNKKNAYDIQIDINGYAAKEVLFFVAHDSNKNGKPDEDEWREIRTNNFNYPQIRDYEITFTYEGYDDFEEETIFTWKDNQGQSGKKQTYCGFPGYHLVGGEMVQVNGWGNSFTLKGRRIDKTNVSGMPFTKKHYLNINDAVTSEGEPANLLGIDFLKIENAGMLYSKEETPPMGSRSEVKIQSIVDLHLLN